jgi:hypothetical protein
VLRFREGGEQERHSRTHNGTATGLGLKEDMHPFQAAY